MVQTCERPKTTLRLLNHLVLESSFFFFFRSRCEMSPKTFAIVYVSGVGEMEESKSVRTEAKIEEICLH